MQYFVIGPDGAKYGPADIPTLKQWAADNRVAPQTTLEDSATGQRLAAGQVQGIFEGPHYAQPAPGMPSMNPAQQQNLYQNPQAYYPRQQVGDGGKMWITLSWVFSSIGFLCCPIIFSTCGIVFAFVGGSQGHPKSLAPKLFGVFTLVAGTVLGILSNNWAQEFLRQLQQRNPR